MLYEKLSLQNKALLESIPYTSVREMVKKALTTKTYVCDLTIQESAELLFILRPNKPFDLDYLYNILT